MFLISKILTALTQPMSWLAVWWGLSLLILPWRQRAGMTMLWSGFVLMGLLGFQAIPDALLRHLENRYAPPSAEIVSRSVGVIVLGGGIGRPDIYLAHGQIPLGDAAERMTIPLSLLRQHPEMTLVFSGGEGRLLATGWSEAQLAEIFFREQGVPKNKLQFEAGSRNTRENARNVAKLLGPRCNEPWLLVTSASHMPRAMAEFGATNCKVTPYPVDFRTGGSTALSEYSLAYSMVSWQTAIHEWLGLLAYRLTR